MVELPRCRLSLRRALTEGTRSDEPPRRCYSSRCEVELLQLLHSRKLHLPDTGKRRGNDSEPPSNPFGLPVFKVREAGNALRLLICNDRQIRRAFVACLDCSTWHPSHAHSIGARVGQIIPLDFRSRRPAPPTALHRGCRPPRSRPIGVAVDTTDSTISPTITRKIAPAERTKAAARVPTTQASVASDRERRVPGMWPRRVRRVCGNRRHKRERPTSHAVSAAGQTKKPAKKPLKTPCITFRH